jgi:hypothetical protein
VYFACEDKLDRAANLSSTEVELKLLTVKRRPRSREFKSAR